jgi:hypothetical protein
MSLSGFLLSLFVLAQLSIWCSLDMHLPKDLQVVGELPREVIGVIQVQLSRWAAPLRAMIRELLGHDILEITF